MICFDRIPLLLWRGWGGSEIHMTGAEILVFMGLTMEAGVYFRHGVKTYF